jgi:hypothetical protein
VSTAAHAIHIPQPFDVAIARSLEVALKMVLLRKLQKIVDMIPGKRKKTDHGRCFIVELFLTGIQQ